MGNYKSKYSGEQIDAVVGYVLGSGDNIVVITFAKSDWGSGDIFIPYSDYKKANPCVDLYLKHEDEYCLVYGGYKIVSDGIKLQSDIAYDGKVVIR